MAASAALSVAGTIVGASQSRATAEAEMNASVESQEAQNTGFFERNAAQSAQNQRDYAIQSQTISEENQAQQQLEQQQQAARQSREQQISDANAQTQAIGNAAQQKIATAEDQASAENQQKAAQQQVQEVQALVSPGVNDISTGTTQTPTGPVAAPAQTDNETASAIATRLAQAASATRDYAQRQATVASASAPLTLMTTTTQDLNAATQPLTMQQKTIESALPTLLEPSTVAYSNANSYYQQLLKALQTANSGQLAVSSAIGTGQTDEANLKQSDTTTAAQNAATLAQYQAAMNPTASILSGLGQLGMFASGAAGGLNAALGGAGQSSLAGWLSGVTGSDLGGIGAPTVGTETITPYWTGLMKGASL